ncbi:MAG: condensation domain-containing protein, partial [Actinoallomurus sp.]
AYRAELPVAGAETAARAVRALVERHAALRLRFTAGEDGAWTQAITEPGEDDGYTPEIDLRALAEGRREAAVREMTDELAAELDPLTGPVLRSAVFRLGEDTRRLALLVHELVVDGASWPILLEDLAAGGEAGTVTPDPAGVLLARRMTALEETYEPAPPAGDQARRAEDYLVGGGLDAEGRDALFGGAREVYRMSPAEVMTAVVASALLASSGASRVDAEVDRRDGERPAGPYASVAPIDLGPVTGDSPAALLTLVKESLRSATPGSDAPAPILIRHLGRLPGAAPEIGLRHPGDGPLTIITSYETADGLRVELVSRAADEEEICGLARALPEAMRTLTEHFAAPGAGAVSPSDFPLAGLDEDELAAFAALVAAPERGHAKPEHEEI